MARTLFLLIVMVVLAVAYSGSLSSPRTTTSHTLVSKPEPEPAKPNPTFKAAFDAATSKMTCAAEGSAGLKRCRMNATDNVTLGSLSDKKGRALEAYVYVADRSVDAAGSLAFIATNMALLSPGLKEQRNDTFGTLLTSADRHGSGVTRLGEYIWTSRSEPPALFFEAKYLAVPRPEGRRPVSQAKPQ